MRVLIIPPWLSKQQAMLQFSNAAYTDPKQLSKLLSTDDMATYMTLQCYAAAILGDAVVAGHLNPVDLRALPCDDEAYANAFRLADYVILDPKQWPVAIFAGLYPAVSAGQIGMRPVLITEDTIGIFFEYHADADPVALRKAFLEALMNILYAFNAFENIAAQPFFKEYLYLARNHRLPLQSTVSSFCQR